MRRKSTGFTLIEVMVAVGIAAILSRIGFDIYTQYIMRANRSLARTTLQTLAAKEELQLLQGSTTSTGVYVTDFYSLIKVGSSNTQTTYYIDQGGVAATSQAGGSIYQISFSSVSTTAYVLQATAVGIQARRDKDCTTLQLSNTGLKAAQNSGGTAQSGTTLSNCWEK